MSLFSRFERRAVETTEARGWYPMTGLGVKNVTNGYNTTAALQVSASHFCVSMIADSIATLPGDVFVKKDGETVRIDQPRWLTKPNVNDTFVDFMQKVMTSLLFDGNAYIFVTRNAASVISEMFVLYPGDVEVSEVNNKKVFTFNDAQYDSGTILHIAGLLLPGSLTGVSPLESMRLSLDLASTAERFGRDFFNDGIHMSGVIEMPQNTKIGEEEAQRMSESFGANHTGGKHAVGVLTGGATWKPITITPEQAQFLETRRFNKIDIALFYKIPAYMVDPTVASSWGSGIAEQNLMYLQQTLMPYIVKIEQAFSAFLLAGSQYFKFNTRALTRGRPAEELDMLVKATNNGLRTINEARALLDLPAVAGGDDILLPLNITPLAHQERKLELTELQAEASLAQANQGGITNDAQN